MSTHLPIGNSDINAWMAFNNYFNGINENLDIQLNANNPPTIKDGFRCTFYKTDNSYTIPSGTATGNNEYEAGDTPTYQVNEAIYEDGGDLTFTWGATVRGETLPAQSDGTWFIYLSGSYDQNSSSIGQGNYNISKTETPVPTIVKNGAYSAAGNRVLGSFQSASGVVSGLSIYDNKIYQIRSTPSFAPVQAGQFFVNTNNQNRYIATGVGSVDKWHLVYGYGTTTVTAGGGDVTINLGGNWEGGRLEIFSSRSATDYMMSIAATRYNFVTTYDALTSGSYTDRQLSAISTPSTYPNTVIKTANNSGIPKSATTTSFTLDDDGANNAYVKWIITA